MPTRAEYETAKQHQQDHPELYAVADPTAEVLANVAVINGYEQSLTDDGTCWCCWYVATTPNVCACTHADTDHVDGLCVAPPAN